MRNRRNFRYRILLLATLAILTPQFEKISAAAKPGAGQQVSYRSVLLDQRRGDAEAITETGAIVGTIYDDSLGFELQIPFYWVGIPTNNSIDVVSTALSTGGYLHGKAEDIKNDDPNNSYDGEWICGFVFDPAASGSTIQHHPVIWSGPQSEPIFLPTLENALTTQAMLINRAGIVVGIDVSESAGVYSLRLIAWGLIAEDTGIRPVGPVIVGTGNPYDINRHGLVVGVDRSVTNGTSSPRAASWQIDFDPQTESFSLGGTKLYSSQSSSYANAVNDAGYIGVQEYSAETGWEAFLIDPQGNRVTLPSIPNPNLSGSKGKKPNDDRPGVVTEYSPYDVTGLNNLTTPQVVGSWFYSGALWQGGEGYDLKQTVGNGEYWISEPTAINDSGWIIGNGPLLMIPE